MYQEDHLTASRPPNKSRCRVLVGNYIWVCVFPSGPSQGIYHGEFATWGIFFGQNHQPKTVWWESTLFWTLFLQNRRGKTSFFDLLGWSYFGSCLWPPPRKQNKKLLCEGNSSSQTTFVLENMPLRTPPVAGRRKQALPRTQKLTSLWANKPGMFSSIYLLNEELFGTCSNPQNYKARPLTPWASTTLQPLRDRFQPWQVGPAFKSLPWAVLPMARPKRNSMRRHGKGVAASWQGAVKNGDFVGLSKRYR